MSILNPPPGSNAALASPEPPIGGGLPVRFALSRERGPGRWFGHDRQTGESVFVKIDADITAIEREAAALAAIRDPGVVGLRACGRSADGAFLVTSGVDGRDLQTILGDHGRLAAAEAARLLTRLAAALDAVHRAGWLHRDLKPANIVVAADGAPVIVDFGAATQLTGVPRDEAYSDLTHGYAAPEQYQMRATEDRRTDVYGLAAIGYRALTGEAPRPAPARRRDAALPALAGISASAEAGRLAAAVTAGLRLDPSMRPSDAPAFARLFAGNAATADPNPPTVRIARRPPPSPPPASPPPPQRLIEPIPMPGDGGGDGPGPGRGGGAARRWPWLLPALIAIGLAAGLGWFAWDRAFGSRSVWLVDAGGQGDLPTIGEAIARSRDGALILVRPGTYAESLLIDRPVQLRAADPAQPPLVAPVQGPCVTASATGAQISGFAFRGGEAGGAAAGCILITGGDLSLIDARIGSGPGPAIVIAGAADPLIRDTTITDGRDVGLLVTAGARGRIEGNRWAGLSRAAILVRGGEPAIAGNTFERSGSVVFAERAKGSFERNTILSGTASGLQITGAAEPRVAGNTIEAPSESAIFVYEGGAGTIDANIIRNAGLSGIVLDGAGTIAITGNTITGSGEYGILALGAAAGRIDGNTVSGSRRNGIVLGEDARVELGRNTLEGNPVPQVIDARRR